MAIQLFLERIVVQENFLVAELADRQIDEQIPGQDPIMACRIIGERAFDRFRLRMIAENVLI